MKGCGWSRTGRGSEGPTAKDSDRGEDAAGRESSDVEIIAIAATLRAELRRAGRAVAVRLEGELDLLCTDVLPAALAELEADELTLDCSGVSFCDAAGATALSQAKRHVQRTGRSLQIQPISEPLRRIVELLGMQDELF